MRAECASRYGVYEVPGSRGETHTVSLSGDAPPHCSCRAFKYGGTGTCKHIIRVRRGACNGETPPQLHPITFTIDADAGEDCPACGGPTVPARRAA